MKDESENIVVIEPENALVKVVKESGLEKTKANYILEKFQDYFRIAADWEVKAKSLVVSSATQVAEMKMAREGRLFLKQKRVDIEKARKELKEQSLREGKAIDGVANVLKGLIEPIEDYLDRQERFVEIQEDESREKRKVARISEMQSLGLDVELYDVKNMPEVNYKQLIEGTRLAIQEAARREKEEAERIKKEKAEAERMRVENERLKKEAEEKEQELAKERLAAEAKQKAVEEQAKNERIMAEERAAKLEAEAEAREKKLREEQKAKEKQLRAEQEAREKKLRVEQEAKLETERKEREKLQAELKAKAEAEAREKGRIADEENRARQAPDKQKLLAFAKTLSDLAMPEVKSTEAKKVIADISVLINKTVRFIQDKTKEL